jgi:hypothetical protein
MDTVIKFLILAISILKSLEQGNAVDVLYKDEDLPKSLLCLI